MSKYIELEIQKLLNEAKDLNEIAEQLFQYLNAHPENLNSENITAISRFLLNANLNNTLVAFILQYIEKEEFPVPWPYFLEALANTGVEIDETTARSLSEGIYEDNATMDAARSTKLGAFIPELQQWSQDRKTKIQHEYLSNKELLLNQLITLRTQQLYEQEKKVLYRLQKLYPGDLDVFQEVREHRQRHALDILQKKSPRQRSVQTSDLVKQAPEEEKTTQALMESLKEHTEKWPEMAFDFAIVAFMLEEFETSLELQKKCTESNGLLWLRLETLLHARRFLELLHEVTNVELKLASDPETFFGTAYYRAQALWGLGQKHAAMEILEALLTARPNYRAASALLSIWSQQ